MVRDGEELERFATEPIEAPQLIVAEPELEPEAWRHLDLARERTRAGSTRALIVSDRAADVLPAAAPNLWSWLDNAIYFIALDGDVLTEDARERRLRAIRTKYAGELDDASVVRAMEAGRAPHDPEIAEWLVLLRRGDLLTRDEP